MGTSKAESKSLKTLEDSEAQRFVTETWPLIKELYAPQHLILFGSRIQGRAHEWSDLDAIIVSERFAAIRPVRRSYEFKSAVQPHISMTALCYTPSEFEQIRSSVGVVADACREGVWIE